MNSRNVNDMRKRKFYSVLYKRDVLPDEKDFFLIVKEELEYRITYFEIRNCDCSTCQEELEEYRKALAKLGIAS